MISAQTAKTTGFVADITSLTVSSDSVNSELMSNSSDTAPGDSEFDNLPALQEKIKSILLIQVLLPFFPLKTFQQGRANQEAPTHQALQLYFPEGHEKRHQVL